MMMSVVFNLSNGASNMKKLALILVLISSLACSFVQADTITGTVVRITDGDTWLYLILMKYSTRSD